MKNIYQLELKDSFETQSKYLMHVKSLSRSQFLEYYLRSLKEVCKNSRPDMNIGQASLENIQDKIIEVMITKYGFEELPIKSVISSYRYLTSFHDKREDPTEEKIRLALVKAHKG